MEKLNDACEEFLVYQSGIRNLSEHSLSGYRNDLRLFREYLSALYETDDINLAAVTTEDIRACIGMQTKQKRAPASINRFLAAVRQLFSYCRRLGYISSNPAFEIKSVKMPRKIPRFMTPAEVHALCAFPEKKELLWAVRDRAVFEILYSSGCRVSEVAGLLLRDISADLKSAVVLGKGNKERRVFFSDAAACALRSYLPERSKLLVECRRQNVSALFVNRRGTRLSARGIWYIVARYSSAEGTNKPVSPHAFRHTFATSMLSNGADVRVVQELLGHESISTTQRYTHVTTARLVDIYNRSHPHGGGSTS
ncbi:MAG: tyrosine-type recombinase/integrase [Bacteroides sp.]|nr:tyrosine-type recombinase/integrase [Prevotella sp.]MCM1407433.1 tyrosine-type recombinase/integrase [Treponema brennaborense]MCM1469923.1 tyrosine-type recombinase/integrase [Bacteroides sp.]